MRVSLSCFMCRLGAMALMPMIVLLGSTNLPGDVVLLQDDFNDNSLDTGIWFTDLSIPQGGASVTEQNNRMELVNRGHLNTVSEFDPTVLPGGITITGKWTFDTLGNGDMFQVLTRSDGVPENVAGKYGETQNGIQFRAYTISNGMGISARGASLAVGNQSNATVDIAAGNVFDFTIVDDGANLSFTMTQVGNPSNTGTATAVVTADTFGMDHVVFHNREHSGGTPHIAFLDDVVITTVPEPSTLLLLAMGLSGLAVVRRRHVRAEQGPGADAAESGCIFPSHGFYAAHGHKLRFRMLCQ
ncbi:MAG: PEP-CTERM sorting domain-containing protein [Planctomycetota bacterium]|nr:PEP-CTERM sorting domain-containing protein [Planctomycetota bacterium]